MCLNLRVHGTFKTTQTSLSPLEGAKDSPHYFENREKASNTAIFLYELYFKVPT